MHIGAVADRTGLSLRTLRHYDEVGVLRPSGRTDGGFRLYTQHDVERLLLIRRMKPLGFTLEEMREVLDLVESLEDPSADPQGTQGPRERLAAFVVRAEQRRAELARTLEMADEFIDLLRRR
ncbi:MerR family transcriptional regulator [Actinotalea sp. AC32]|nr:MerR family transcriptional regulator [Actinotalea sp. AC32]